MPGLGDVTSVRAIGVIGSAAAVSRLWDRPPFVDGDAVRRPWRRMTATVSEGGELYSGGDETRAPASEEVAVETSAGASPAAFVRRWTDHGLRLSERVGEPPDDRLTPAARFDGKVASALALVGDAAIEMRLRVGRTTSGTTPCDGVDAACAQFLLLRGEPQAFFNLVRTAIKDADGALRLAIGRDCAINAALAGPPDAGLIAPMKISIDPDADAGEALAEGLAACAARLLETRSFLADGRSPEGARHARVALRRLRSFEKCFRDAVAGDRLRKLSRRARRLARQIGAARDWDVFISETLPMSGVDGFEPKGARRLMKAAARCRKAEWRRVEAAVAAPSFDQLALDAFAAAASQDWRRDGSAALSDPAKAFAAVALDERASELQDVAARIAVDDPATLHDLRLSLKRFRYVAQIFKPAYAKEIRKPYFKRLGALQESLGVLNDNVVAERLCDAAAAGEGARAVRAAGFVCGVSRQRATDAATTAIDACRALLETPPFWRDGEATPILGDRRFQELAELLRDMSGAASGGSKADDRS
ncbi:MAG: CHAD domain-containing protein [Alphaproteobacteria bacterium]|nr:CHAD domain-containing protein [Alphaproteobacteria bacterium]